jgi:hypothetical protein
MTGSPNRLPAPFERECSGYAGKSSACHKGFFGGSPPIPPGSSISLPNPCSGAHIPTSSGSISMSSATGNPTTFK